MGNQWQNIDIACVRPYVQSPGLQKISKYTNNKTTRAVVVHIFSLNTQEAEASESLEFEASLVYRYYRKVRAIQRNHISTKQNNNNKNNKI